MTDADCPGGPCIDVSIGGMTVRGCADARAATDGGAAPDASVDGGAIDPVVTLAAAGRTACALRASGVVSCWGANDNGQLGDVGSRDGVCHDRGTGGDYPDHSVRAVMGPITGATRLAVGAGHVCVRVDGASHLGEARCWGDNGDGQLGRSTTSPVDPTPVTVVDAHGAPLTGVMDVAAWGQSSIAVTTAGLYGWGDGQHGQIGTMTATTFETTPLLAALPAGVTLHGVAFTEASLGIDGDGHARSWGWNKWGTLGRGTDADAAVVDFLPVPGLDAVLEVDVGLFAACARTSSDVMCWGWPWTALARDGNHSECLLASGDGSSCPRSVSGLGGAPVAVAVSGSATCIALQTGQVQCTSATSEQLTTRGGLPPMATLVAGDEFFCGLTTDGRVFCWGRGSCGQTGDPALPDDGEPHEVVLP